MEITIVIVIFSYDDNKTSFDATSVGVSVTHILCILRVRGSEVSTTYCFSMLSVFQKEPIIKNYLKVREEPMLNSRGLELQMQLVCLPF